MTLARVGPACADLDQLWEGARVMTEIGTLGPHRRSEAQGDPVFTWGVALVVGNLVLIPGITRL